MDSMFEEKYPLFNAMGQKLFLKVLDSSSNTIFCLDDQGRIVFANKHIEVFLTSPLSEIIGKKWQDTAHASRLGFLERHWDKILAGKELWIRSEVDFQDATPWEITARVFSQQEPGQDFMAVVIIENISQSLELRRNLRKKTNLLNLLYDLQKLLSGCMEPAKIMGETLRFLKDRLLMDFSGFYTETRDEHVYYLKEHHAEGVLPDEVRLLFIKDPHYEKNVLFIEIEKEDTSFLPLKMLGIWSLISIPLETDAHRSFMLLGSRDKMDLSSLDIKFFSALRASVSGFLNKARLFSRVEQAKKEWESTFDAINDPLLILDTNLRVLRCNVSACFRIPGFTPGVNVQSCQVFKCQHEEFCPSRKTLETGQIQSGRVLEPINNRHYYVTSYPVFSPEGNLEKIIEYRKDITSLVEADSLNHLLARALKSTRDCVIIFDPRGKILFVNNSAQELFGIHGEEIKGADFSSIFLFSLPQCMQNNILHEALKDGWEGEIVQINGDNQKFPSYIRFSPYRDEKDKLKFVVVVIRELTREKELMKKLIHAEKLTSMGEMVSTVAHELNNPLTGIMGYTEILKMKLDEQSEVETYCGSASLLSELREYLKIVLSQSQRAKKIVRDLLVFSRMQSSDRELSDINLLLTHTAEMMTLQMQENGIRLELNLDPHLPSTIVDPSQLQRVFINIITNAQQAINSKKGFGNIRVKTYTGGGYILVEISDDGPGIPKNVINNIFNPFFTTKEEGTGLGLSLSYGIVKNNYGDIMAKNNEEEGATFLIKLPILKFDYPLTTEKRKKEDLLPTLDTSRYRVLVVDDEESILKLSVRILQGMGFKNIFTAEDGSGAIQILEKEHPDLSITDIIMPLMGGRELYQFIRYDSDHKNTRFVFLSGGYLDEEIGDFLKKETLSCIMKPFTVQEFMETVRSALSE